MAFNTSLYRWGIEPFIQTCILSELVERQPNLHVCDIQVDRISESGTAMLPTSIHTLRLRGIGNLPAINFAGACMSHLKGLKRLSLEFHMDHLKKTASDLGYQNVDEFPWSLWKSVASNNKLTRSPVLMIPRVTVPSLSLSGAWVAHVGSVVNLTALIRLSLCNCHGAEELLKTWRKQNIPIRLKHLTLKTIGSESVIQRGCSTHLFFLKFTGLEELFLRIKYDDKIHAAILDKHAPTLKRFHYLASRTGGPPDPIDGFLSRISVSCPNLVELGMTVRHSWTTGLNLIESGSPEEYAIAKLLPNVSGLYLSMPESKGVDAQALVHGICAVADMQIVQKPNCGRRLIVTKDEAEVMDFYYVEWRWVQRLQKAYPHIVIIDDHQARSLDECRVNFEFDAVYVRSAW